MTIARLVIGVGVMYAGFHLIAVATPPAGMSGMWSMAGISVLAIGAAITGHAGLDLMGVK
jgi:hypothetical protein